MKKLNVYLAPLVTQRVFTEPVIIPKRGRPMIGDRPMTQKEHRKKHRDKKKSEREKKIGVIDFETDPFDNKTQDKIFPFLACIHSDDWEPIIIWDDCFPSFVKRLRAALAEIFRDHGPYTFYAHNGGKFDFMFLISELRGDVSFKGRGIMTAKLEGHDLRDSFHLIPEALANFAKEKFNYEFLKRAVRHNYRDKSIAYVISDCKYLLQILKAFIDEFGIRLSIGQAAMMKLKESYPEIEKVTPSTDEFLRTWFFGGRVECLKDRGQFEGDYILIDLNSAYPDRMANCKHPIGSEYLYRTGDPGPATVFIDLDCKNRGALIGRTAEGETTARIKQGRFYTTIWEYECALKHGLISDVVINFCVDSDNRTDFSKFVLPLYERRQLTKRILKEMKAAGKENTPEYLNAKKDDIFLKLLLNNAYGKFAQNPRNHKEHYLTDPGETPPPDWFKSIASVPLAERSVYELPSYEGDTYSIWSKPAPRQTFNNVGTAASIAGAVRAVLLDAICRAVDPIYCDTDSIICRSISGVRIDPEALGAWDIEDEFKSVVIAGKKLYATESIRPKTGPDGQISPYKIKSKGVAGLVWDDMSRLLAGEEIPVTSKGPALDRYGAQNYLTRKIRATAQQRNV